MTAWHFLVPIVLSAWGALAAAGEQREFELIGEGDPAEQLPVVERQQVEDWLEELAEAWNSRELEDYLAPSFPDRERLLGAIDEQVPPDARLRVLAVGPMRVVDEERDADGITRVIRVTVRFQVRGTGQDGTLQRREGRQDLIIRWQRRLP